jgi:hypothetical protein
MITLRDPATGAVECVNPESLTPPADWPPERGEWIPPYAGWEQVCDAAKHDPDAELVNDAWEVPLAKAEEKALELVEAAADEAAAGQVARLRRQVAMAKLWDEVQLLKLYQELGRIAALDAIERRKRFPFLMAIVEQSGNTITQVATAIENRLSSRVWAMALAEAKLLLAHDAVRAAATSDEKIAAAMAVNWSLT